MSDPTVYTLSQLPPEILHGIFYYLDIPDILRARRVSRYLNQISHGRDVWSDAYRKAEFVCPPGPFPSQSAHDIENALVSSFRVHRNLHYDGGISQTEKLTRKLTEIPYAATDPRASFVFGQFLLVAFKDEVCCYDLNPRASGSNSDASIIYRTTDGILKSFHCASAIDLEGRRFACVVLNETRQTTSQISIYLLDVGGEFEVTLKLLHQFERRAFEISAINLGPRVLIIQGLLDLDLDADRHLVALDVYTRTPLQLPSFAHATLETYETSEFAIGKVILPTNTLSTSTHLLLAYSSYYPATRGWRTVIWAFALPHPNAHRQFTSTSIPLSLCHSGIIHDIRISGPALLHDSVLDPTTQDVLISIQVRTLAEFSSPVVHLLKHGILRLSNQHTLSDHDSGVGTITFQLRGLLTSLHMQFLHPSFNGTGRVFRTFYTGSTWVVEAFEYDLRASDDDNDNERMGRVTEYPFMLVFPTLHALLDYDPYFGRICLQGDNVIEVLDLAV